MQTNHIVHHQKNDHNKDEKDLRDINQNCTLLVEKKLHVSIKNNENGLVSFIRNLELNLIPTNRGTLEFKTTNQINKNTTSATISSALVRSRPYNGSKGPSHTLTLVFI
jgi:hypothetical protein